MSTRQPIPEIARFAEFDSFDIEVLSTSDERSLLKELVECKRKLAQALSGIKGLDIPPDSTPQATAKHIAAFYSENGPGPARLRAVHCRYSELRSKLALANVKLVAHVAKRFRDRGISYSDLLQEGFCGLLEAIDRLSQMGKILAVSKERIRQIEERALGKLRAAVASPSAADQNLTFRL